MTDKIEHRQAGGAAIGARLRRLSERIDREANQIYAGADIGFEQRWYGMLNLLAQRGPLCVTEIAEALGVTHVAISQIRRSLVTAGYVTASADEADGRRKPLSLTPQGAALIVELTPLWEALNAAAAALNAEAGDPASALDRLEAALDRAPLAERFAAARAAKTS